MDAGAIVGRDDEVHAIDAAADAASRGEPRVVLVGAPAGMGKSHLLRVVAERLGDGERLGEVERAVAVLTGAGAPGVDVAFAPLHGALRQLPSQIGVDLADELLASVPALCAAVGMRPRGVGEVADGARLDAVYGDALHLIGEVARHATCVLLVDDLHWADPETLSLVSFLSRSLTVERCLVVGAYRDDEVSRNGRLRQLVSTASRDPHATVLTLRPLGAAELVEVAREVGRPIDITAAARLQSRSGGNPFFAIELLLADADGSLPGAVEDLLLSQVDALLGPVRHVLAVAAIAGAAASVSVIRAAADLDDDVLHDALRAAVDARFVTVDRDGVVGFRHALLAEAVARTLLPTERLALHRRIAEELGSHADRVDGPDAHLAHHWRMAGEPAAALRHARAAADDATARHAPAAVLEHLSTILELWDEVDAAESIAGSTRVAVELRASAAACDADARDDAVRLAESAIGRAGDDPELQAVALARLAYALYTSGRMADAHATAAGALAAIEGRPPSVEAADAHFYWAGTGLALGRFRDVVDRAATARAVADALGDAEQQRRCDHAEGTARCAIGQLDAGIALLRRAFEAGIADPRVAGRGAGSAYNLGEVLRSSQPPVVTLGEVEEMLGQLRGTGLHDRFLGVQATIAELLLRLGRLRDLDAHLAPLPALAPFLAAYGLALVRAELAVERGDPAAARLWLGSSDVEGARLYPLGAPRVAAVEARLASALGDHAAALDVARRAVDAAEEAPLRLDGNRLLALAAEAAARSDAARSERDALVERGAELVAGLARLGADPAAQRAWLAVSAGWAANGADDEVDAWTAAVEAVDGAGMRIEAARARLHLAVAALRHGERERAAAALGAAAEVAGAEGATALAAAVGDLRRRARLAAGPEQRSGTDVSGLTPRELEVVRAVAEGATNAEVGTRLFISEKTVSVHLSNAMRKLGVTDRRAAVRAARELGVLSD